MSIFEEALKAMYENKIAYIVTNKRYIIKNEIVYVSSDGHYFEKTKSDFGFSLKEIASKKWIIEDEIYPDLGLCPFCNNKSEIFDHHIYHGKNDDIGTINGYYAKCKNCKAQGPLKKTELEARKKWNKLSNDVRTTFNQTNACFR
jgi:hypothetical protein